LKPVNYKDSGVDIAAGEEAVDRIREKVRTTFSKSVLTDLGKFGGFFSFDTGQYQNPVLVSSVDGVGTKLKVAFLMNKHDSVGEDLVNHCVNDILVGGATPLFFLDYIGTGKLSPQVMEEIVTGMVRGCKNNHCALIGGEMAEMPGLYSAGEYDVVGSIVGVVEKERIVDGRSIQKGDVLIGLSSSGLHTNGYSLARKVLFEVAGFKVSTKLDGLNGTLGDELLRVHRSYLNIVLPLLKELSIHGMSHVTGGGLIGNTKRILPFSCGLDIDWTSWQVPSIFQIIQKEGKIPDQEMRKAFNMGIGFVLIVSMNSADDVMEQLKQMDVDPKVIGKVI